MAIEKKKILLVDDDKELCELLRTYLENDMFMVTAVHDGEQGFKEALTNSYDAIILDVMLPSMDGFTVLRGLGGKISAPILMLTAKGDEVDRIIGLEMGADDYLPKPCNPRELSARLKAIMRRFEKAQLPDISSLIEVGDISLNNANREVKVKEHLLTLTPSQFEILRLLMESSGKMLTKEELTLKALGRELTAFDRSLDMHISHLRSKIEANSPINVTLKTIRGLGYMLEENQ